MAPAQARKVDPEVLEGFLEEARGYLPQLRCGLEALTNPSARRRRALEEAHRQVHCIKGASAMVGLPGLSRIAEQLEGVFEALTCTDAPIPAHAPALLSEAVDLLENYLDATQRGTLDEPPLLEQAACLFQQLQADQPVAEPASDTDEIDPELLEVFAHEAEDHLRIINQRLPLLLEQPGDREVVQDIRRSVHTLKGCAAMVGYPQLTQLAHRMEDLLDQLYEGQRPVTPDTTALLVAATDSLEELASGTADQATLAGLYDRFDHLLSGAPRPVREQPVPAANIVAIPGAPPTVNSPLPPRIDQHVRVPMQRLDELARVAGELVIARGTLEQQLFQCAGQIEELQRCTERLQRAAGDLEKRYEVPALASADAGSKSRQGKTKGARCFNPIAEDFDELELDRYTEFHLLSRAFTETAADVSTVAHELGKLTGDFEASLNQQAQLSSDLQDRLMRLRLVPFQHLASRLQRTVRGVARAQKKEVRLVLEGENTELDKLALEELAEPLLHLLRNAVDHGIEPPDRRREQGKSATGLIRVAARQESNHVVLEISDDGAGIDLASVRRTALERGCADPGALATMTEADLLALLFAPGFSTTGQVSEVSGRGVGLDIVRTRVQQLKGTVTLASALGSGTTFTIRLPVNMAVLKALLVQAGDQTFAVPLASIMQIARLDVDAVADAGDQSQLRVGDVVAPRVELLTALGLPASAQPPARPPVLLLRSAAGPVAVLVERLLEAREVVVKGLGSHLQQVPGITGATLLGDGSVVLIVNPDDLCQPARSTPIITREFAAPASASAALTVMVVDDSPSVRRVVGRLLHGQGWTVLPARDGLEALEVLHHARVLPDLMFVDVEMPRMDGFELVATLRNNPAWAHIPAVMLTSRSGSKHRQKAQEVGANGYVVKPYQDAELLEIIRELIAARR